MQTPVQHFGVVEGHFAQVAPSKPQLKSLCWPTVTQLAPVQHPKQRPHPGNEAQAPPPGTGTQ
jgi:hypothetical protein